MLALLPLIEPIFIVFAVLYVLIQNLLLIPFFFFYFQVTL